MNAPEQFLPRAGSAAWLWALLWTSLLLLFAVMAWDGWRHEVPFLLLASWFLPILIVVPGILKDRLRSVTWLSFISLLYFVLAILRIFAEPTSLRAQLELLAVVGVFNSSMFYVRQRARQLRGVTGNAASGEPD